MANSSTGVQEVKVVEDTTASETQRLLKSIDQQLNSLNSIKGVNQSILQAINDMKTNQSLIIEALRCTNETLKTIDRVLKRQTLGV